MSAPADQTITFRLREAARTCSDIDMRAALRAKADELRNALADIYNTPTEEHAQRLTGLWAASDRLLKNMKPEASPGGSGAGLQEGALLAQAA